MVFEGSVLTINDHGTFRKTNKKFRKSSNRAVGLLLANKQIHEETIQVYYHNLAVESLCVRKLGAWIRNIPPRYLQLVPEIKHVHFTDLSGSYLEQRKRRMARVVDVIASDLRRAGVVVAKQRLLVDYRKSEDGKYRS